MLVECNALSKSYGAKTALNNVSFSVDRGKIVGLLGPNGSGKTTLIKILSGLLTASAGSITVSGNPIGIETKKIVSYLPERTYLSEWMTVRQAMNFFRDFYPDFSEETAADMLGRLKIDTSEKLRTMSKGTKEKVQLILVMSRRAELYLLDEPIGGVDPAARDYILKTIISNCNENSSVIISTHLISDIENVLDDVIFLKYGTLTLHRTADEIREEYGKYVDALFREVFAC